MIDKINRINNRSQNPKKRVLFVITQEEFGGAQRFLYELTTRLDKERYEILVASGSASKSEFLKSLVKTGIKTERLRFLKRELNPIYDCFGIVELMKLINRFRPEYLYLNSSKAGALGGIAGFKMKILRPKKFKKLKVIYRIGGWSFNDPWPLWKKKLFIAVEKMTARFKNVIVVNSRHDYEQALRLRIRPKKELKLIHNGIDALKIEFLPRDEACLELFKNLSKKTGGIPRSDFIIGTIANFYPTKGLEYLIDAANISKDQNLKFLIIGDGQERENLESKIEKYGLDKKVMFLGQIPEAHKYIKAFDIFVLPSVKEGFPWVVLDAMAAKLPIVATNVGAVPEMIENGKNGMLVEPRDSQQLAEAINYLIENERTRQELGIQAHQTALFKFPIEKMMKETEELFNPA